MESQKQAGQSSRVKRPRRSQRRLMPFDRAALAALRSGASDVAAIAKVLNVATKELEERLAYLEKRGLVACEGGAIKLTIKGFNLASRCRGRTEPIATPSAVRSEPLVQRSEQMAQVSEALPAQAAQVQARVVKEVQRGVQEAQQTLSATQAAQVQAQGAPQEALQKAQAEALSTSERCELCKAPFRYSLVDPSAGKWGHCWCGAAYHRSCYESLFTTTSLCVRCGKKLKIILERSAEEAIKPLKEIF